MTQMCPYKMMKLGLDEDHSPKSCTIPGMAKTQSNLNVQFTIQLPLLNWALIQGDISSCE